MPGLGQAVLGAYRRAILVFLPALALALAALRAGPHGLERDVLDPSFLAWLWWVNLAAFAYHVLAVVDAYFLARRRSVAGVPIGSPRASIRTAPDLPRMARPPRVRRSASWAASALSLVVLASTIGATTAVHGYVAVVDAKDQAALAAVFNPVTPWGDSAAGTAAATAAATAPIGTFVTPGPTPSPTPAPQWTGKGTLSVLLIGIDRGPGGGRTNGLRPDSMILLRVDTATGRAAMFGIPRNIVNVPLPPEVAAHYSCGCYPDLLDYFWQEAADIHPQWYTAAYGTDRYVRGIRALEGAVGQLAGVHMDGAFVIDLIGFIKLVDSVGGINIDVPKELRDTQYPILAHPGDMTIDIKAGVQHMNGVTALEYARSRHSTDDYDRMRRQQLVLRAIRDSVAHPCSMIPRLPGILDAINGTFWTDLPIQSAPDLLALAEHVGTANTASFTLVPANFASGSTDVQIPEYLDAASIATVRGIVAHGFDKVPAASKSAGSGGGGFSC